MENPLKITLRDAVTPGPGPKLECKTLLRSIKGRRAVYDGLCNGQPVVIKMFLSAMHGKRHFNREYQGFNELVKRNIPTSPVVSAGRDEEGHYVLALEKIADATDVFSVVFNAPESNPIDDIVGSVFATVAGMNQAGIFQRDLHLGNFLKKDNTIYVLDPAEMQFGSSALSKPQCYQQLAILLASMPETITPNKQRLIQTYFDVWNWKLDQDTVHTIESMANGIRLNVAQSVIRKTMGKSKRSTPIQSGHCKGILRPALFHEPDSQSFVESINDRMESGQILKRGNTCFVSRVQVGNHDIVVKRYNHKGLWHSFRHTLKGSRAKKCWRFGLRMELLGIPTASPLGFLQRRKCGLIWESYILNEYVDGPDIQAFKADPDIPDTTKEAVCGKVCEMLERLAYFKMTHGDLKPGNILIAQNNPVLIDLDSMKFHRHPCLLNYYKKKMDINISQRKLLWKK